MPDRRPLNTAAHYENRLLSWAVLAILLALAVSCVAGGIVYGVGRLHGIDLRNYLAAAQIGLTAGWSHIYDADLQRPLLQPFWAGMPGRPHGYWEPFASPPPVAFIVVPLTGLRFAVALWIWIAVCLAGLGVAAWLLCRLWRTGRLRAVLLVAASPAVLYAAAGNITALLLAATAGAFVLLRANRPVLAGILLGSTVLKPQAAALLLPALVAGRSWGVAAGYCATGVVLLGSSLLALGTGGIHDYVNLLRVVGGFTQQAAVALPRVLPLWAAVVTVTLAVVATVGAAWSWRGRGAEGAAAAGLIGSAVIAPYLNPQDLSLTTASVIALLSTPISWLERVLVATLALSVSWIGIGATAPRGLAALLVLGFAVVLRLRAGGELSWGRPAL